jgi:hypothetical protein
MSKIIDRYSSAVRSSNLRSKEATTYSDTDVLAAVGIAGHAQSQREDGSTRNNRPLAVALERLLLGDNHAAAQIVDILAEMAWGKAAEQRVQLKRPQAQDMARSVLAWMRFGTCKTCGGHGFQILGTIGAGRAVKTDHECQACKGSRKVPFGPQFPAERRSVAWWLLAQVEREQGHAGPAAMAALAKRL